MEVIRIAKLLAREKALASLRLFVSLVILVHYHYQLVDSVTSIAGYIALTAALVYSLVLFFWPRNLRIPASWRWLRIILDFVFISFVVTLSGSSGRYLFFLYYLPIIGLAIEDGLTSAVKAAAIAGFILAVFKMSQLTSAILMEIASFQIVALFSGSLLEHDSHSYAENVSRDSLTNLLTKIPFHEVIESRLADSNSQGVALLLLDIDRFVQFNERFGHQRGNHVLKAIAEMIQENLRTGDVVARYGGEEFAILLPDIGEDGALQIAERLRSNIMDMRFPEVQEPVCVSIGLAVCPDDNDCAEGLVSLARKRMYRAKDIGGNRVITSLTE